MQARIELRGGAVIADLDHLPFVQDVQKSINASVSKRYKLVIDALAKLGESEIARRNRITTSAVPKTKDAGQ